MNTVPITELAAVIRSKNAGPYELTVDIMFKDERDYLQLRKIRFFTKELFARIYGIPVSRIINVVYFDAAFAVKCTMVRPTVSGAPGDTDIYGAQQHAPLLKLRVPLRET
jgi:hypothetical protein